MALTIVVAEAGGLVLVVALIVRAIRWWRDRHGYRGVHRAGVGRPAYHRPMTTRTSDPAQPHPDEDPHDDPLSDPDGTEPPDQVTPEAQARAEGRAAVQVTPAQGQPVQVDPAEGPAPA